MRLVIRHKAKIVVGRPQLYNNNTQKLAWDSEFHDRSFQRLQEYENKPAEYT